MSNGERFARGVERGVENRIEGAHQTGKRAEGIAEGIAEGRVRLTPIKEQLVEELAEAAQTVRDRDKLKGIAKRKLNDWKQAIADFLNKRTDDQLEAAGEFTANAAIDLAGSAIGSAGSTIGSTTGAATGTLGRASGEGVERIHIPSVPARTSRGKNHLQPDPNAVGAHSTFRRDAEGRVKHHAEWTQNPQNPSGFDQSKRVDMVGDKHKNKATREWIQTPHVHDKTVPGGIRAARPDEVPARPRSRP